jgi:UDP-glucose:(heptosyl)LPS alpha-1,3-glucosyltransferase
MKVAIVQEQVDVRRGGSETSTVEMARELACLGLDLTVVCRGAGDEPFVADNVTYLPIAARGLTRLGRTYRFIQGVHRLCRTQRFDIVHAVTPCLSANVYQPRGGTYAETVTRTLARVRHPTLRCLKRLARVFNVRQRFLQRVEQNLLRKRRARVSVAAVSDYVRRQVCDGLGFPGERARVIFNGVDIAPLSEDERTQQRRALRGGLGVDIETPLVIFVAHNFGLKGLAELVRATALAPPQRPWLVVVAGRDDPGRYRRLARRLGVAERVRFVGTQTPVRAWLAAGEVLAHPTWYDPCSRVVLEALSVGLPVVTTRYNGAAEVMQPGRHGVVLDEPGDAPGLAAALTRALDPALHAACRADAPRLHAQLSMSRHARELKAFYEDILAAGPSPHRAPT